MALTNLYKIDKIDLPGPTYIQQITDQSIASNLGEIALYGSGHEKVLMRATSEQAPVIQFTTQDIAAALTAFGESGAAIGSAVYAYAKQVGPGGSTARATTAHTRFAVAKSYGHIGSIALSGAPSQSPGTAQCNINAVYDGTNEPIVIAGSQALTNSITATVLYGAGPVAINGTAIEGVQSINLDFGMTLETIYHSSLPWPIFIGLKMSTPSVRITALDVSQFVTAGIDGLPLNGSSGLLFYARKFTKNQTGGVSRVADATEEHIAFNALYGRYHVPTHNGSGNDPTPTEIIVQPTINTYSDTYFTFDTTAAIS